MGSGGCIADTCAGADGSGTGFEVGVSRRTQPVSDAGGYREGGAQGPISDGPVYDYVWAPTCPTASPTDTGGMCPAAVITCPPGEVRFFAWRRVIDPAGGVGPWERIPGTQCLGAMPTPAPVPADVIAGLVQQEFKSLPLEASTAQVQPSVGTLVNFDTIFYTDTAAREFPLTVLGVGVRVRATPQQWIWHFGDGSEMTSRTPGAKYPSRNVTHQYVTTGTVRPWVSVVWSGTFSIDGRPGTFVVNGTVQRDGPRIDLPVREARSELVSGG